jgi:hypothetical protein
MQTTKDIAVDYFSKHPDAKDEVIRAYLAYHTTHFRDHPNAHNFEGPWRNNICKWCGRSRELVRWDDLPVGCQSRPSWINDLSIESIIKDEEEKYYNLNKRAVVEVPKLIAKMGLSGDTLSTLHHTYGYCPEIISDIVDISDEIMEQYNAKMDGERDLSRKAWTPKVVEANNS